MATTCPECGTTNDPQNAFCEVCGVHFATGEKPAPPPPPAPHDPAASASPTAGNSAGSGSGNGNGPVRPSVAQSDRATLSFMVTERDPSARDAAFPTVPPVLGSSAPSGSDLDPPDPDGPGIGSVLERPDGEGPDRVDPDREALEPDAPTPSADDDSAPVSSAAGATTGATTGAATRATSWIAVVEIDAEFFASNQTADRASELTLPPEPIERRVSMTGDDLLIGRRSASRRITPAIDLSLAPQDTGVSHRHATLSRRGDGWSVTDLGSTNGSWVAGDPEPLEPFVEQPIRPGDSLLIGAWTRITLRRIEGSAHPGGAEADDGDADP